MSGCYVASLHVRSCCYPCCTPTLFDVEEGGRMQKRNKKEKNKKREKENDRMK